jgi:hypothetical protein
MRRSFLKAISDDRISVARSYRIKDLGKSKVSDVPLYGGNKNLRS